MTGTNIDIVQIEENLREGNLTPHELAKAKVTLSGWYAFYSTEMENLLAQRPGKWHELRPNYKSDKATDRAYEATRDGIELMRQGMMMKRIEKMIGAISTMLRLKENEARNFH